MISELCITCRWRHSACCEFLVPKPPPDGVDVMGPWGVHVPAVKESLSWKESAIGAHTSHTSEQPAAILCKKKNFNFFLRVLQSCYRTSKKCKKECLARLHLPGVEPEPFARPELRIRWKANILPLDQRCCLIDIIVRLFHLYDILHFEDNSYSSICF